MEKQRLMIIKDMEVEEPIINLGRICVFKNLTVTTVLINEIYKNPERINKSSFSDIEIKVNC